MMLQTIINETVPLWDGLLFSLKNYCIIILWAYNSYVKNKWRRIINGIEEYTIE